MSAHEVTIDHRITDQVFSYYHDQSMLHFNVSLLARLRGQLPTNAFARVTLDVGPGEYALVMEHRGIEDTKLTALKPEDLREPGYGVLFEDGSFTMVDGHHRLVARYRNGAHTMGLWVCFPEVWRACLVEYGTETEAILAQHLPAPCDNPDLLVSAITLHKPKD